MTFRSGLLASAKNPLVWMVLRQSLARASTRRLTRPPKRRSIWDFQNFSMLRMAGIKAVVAASYARIFFRNSVATGEIFPLESTLDLSKIFRTGDEAVIDLAAATITHQGTGEVYAINPLGAVAPVIEAGGIFSYARATGMIPQN